MITVTNLHGQNTGPMSGSARAIPTSSRLMYPSSLLYMLPPPRCSIAAPPDHFGWIFQDCSALINFVWITSAGRAVVDDVRVTNRISALISAFGVLASTFLLVLAVREYRSGASVLWLVAGSVIFLSALHTLVRDVRRLRTGPAV
ncbi:hypothetical protein OH786_37540 (plasmid) [Streptomyces atratus]|uniref:hypothetical protein n=1 Tax=Streptomyces atratus TaxID=1893 RepID=UPI0032477E93